MMVDVESVLAAHEGWDYGGPGVVECEGCGWKSERLGPEWNGRRGDRHRAHVAAVLREQIEQEVRRRLKRCGCAWCCATTPPEQRGETHKRTCQPLAAQITPSRVGGES